MDKMIYVAMSGAKSVMQRQDNLANNLANASTTGYRAATLAFRALPSANESTGGSVATRVFALETSAGADLSQGPLQRTGNSLDVAIQGQGWIAVQAANGKEAYTRNGALSVNADGVLQTSAGLALLSDAGPLVIPAGSVVTIAPDGTLSAQNSAAPLSEVQVLGRIKLVDAPARALARGDDGLFRSTSGQPIAADPAVRLSPGALEGSNVNPIETMVGMIGAARQFELHMKLLQHAEANSRAAGQLLQLGG